MSQVVRLAGAALIALSALAVIQTGREIALGVLGERRYIEEYPRTRALTFGGHTITVVDDQPYRATDPVHRETEYEGTIRLLMDGRPLGPPSPARVRRARDDMGRYHLWFDAWIFRERSSGKSSLWLARRLQANRTSSPRFEVTTVSEDGAVRRRVVRGWQLATEYRLYRATQFITDGPWTALPLTLGEVMGFFPLLLVVFPVGTTIAGVKLLRYAARLRPHRAAVSPSA